MVKPYQKRYLHEPELPWWTPPKYVLKADWWVAVAEVCEFLSDPIPPEAMYSEEYHAQWIQQAINSKKIHAWGHQFQVELRPGDMLMITDLTENESVMVTMEALRESYNFTMVYALTNLYERVAIKGLLISSPVENGLRQKRMMEQHA